MSFILSAIGRGAKRAAPSVLSGLRNLARGGDEAADIGKATRNVLRSSTIPAGATTSLRQGRRLAAAAGSTAKPRGLAMRAVFGQAGRPLRAQAVTGAKRGALGAGALLGLSYLNGQEDQQAQPFDVGSLGLPSMSATDVRLQRLNQGFNVAEQQLSAQEAALQQMLNESAAADANYQSMLGNYRTNTMRDINAAYGRSADEALRAAQQIEGIGSQAAQDITGEGAAASAALQALAEAPAEAGTGMFTGLVPVSGDLADAPQAAANAANITAEAAQRGVNITRDDLRAAAAMAPMVSEAYGRQVDSQTAQAIALAQIAGQKERAQQQYQETSRITGQRAALAQERAAAEDGIIAEGLALVAPEQLPLLIGQYQAALENPAQADFFASQGVNSFADYVEYIVGPETLELLRSVGSGTAGS